MATNKTPHFSARMTIMPWESWIVMLLRSLSGCVERAGSDVE